MAREDFFRLKKVTDNKKKQKAAAAAQKEKEGKNVGISENSGAGLLGDDDEDVIF
eukprot:NODE_3171_length_806_cov_68.820343_g2645_i0.p5 GENE.NODE_3171_length_806_cov_68.820343_g2645_i0~~NODE_3171_length_806_cov_68.820343_g2645_i0.p5  ORF type:complete len:55 (-),score=27.44 NODE_3171_length_806_cov_68.820343_g2645_i0:22-186(-)